MADELNIPIHRWYEPRNNISLPNSDFSKQWIYDSGIQKIDRWINSQPWGNPINGLFALADPGIWLDPSDLTTMYQDAAGTTAVTTPGQPVGLRLDKSKGLALGAELVANGTFDSGFGAGWVDASGGTGTASISGGVLTLTSAVLPNIGEARQALTVVIGRRYKVNWTAIGSSAQVAIGTTTTGSEIVLDTGASTSGGLFFTATATTVYLRLRTNNTTGTCTFDNVTAKELDGNHATQSVLASRPVYGIEPAGGRRNLLVYSGFDGAVSGTPGTTPTGWSRFLGTPDGTSIYTPNSALLGGGSIRIQTTVSRYQLGQVVPVAANTSYITSVDCNVVTGSTFNNHLDWVAPPSGATVSYRLDGVSVLGGSIVPTGLHKLEAILSVGATAGNGTMRIGVGIQANSTGDITFSNPQLELGSTATPYQRVTTAFDVTEAGVQTCHYVQYDGSDDGMITNSIDFTATDKMSVFAGVRKLSEVNATVVELSADASANNGAFTILAPGNFSSGPPHNNYTAYLRGTAATGIHAAPYTPPITNVVTFSYDIAAASALTEIVPRVNGETPPSVTVSGFTSSSAGIGNFGNYPLYLGRRGGSSFPLNGRDYGIVIVGKATTADEITATERWLSGKTGFYAPIITGVPTIGVS